VIDVEKRKELLRDAIAYRRAGAQRWRTWAAMDDVQRQSNVAEAERVDKQADKMQAELDALEAGGSK